MEILLKGHYVYLGVHKDKIPCVLLFLLLIYFVLIHGRVFFFFFGLILFFKIQEDIELISKLGFKAYRFSISWSRIFPGIKLFILFFDDCGLPVSCQSCSY